jgi:hypothetical protein
VLKSIIAGLFFLVASQARAQDNPALQIILPGSDRYVQLQDASAGLQSPAVASRGVLSAGQIRSLVTNGFPARLHYKLEEWSVGRIFDNLKRTAEWDVVLRYDPLSRKYEVFRITGTKAVRLGAFTDFDGSAAAAESPYVTLMPAPKKGQRGYYSLVLEVESLSLTDLDEVERWLRGELKPAIRGEKSPGTALSRGLGTLFVRLLGGDKHRYETRTGKFTAQ